MAAQDNLTESCIEKLEEFFNDEIKPNNEDAVFRRVMEPMQQPRNDPSHNLALRIQALENEVAELTTYLKTVFDGHMLINGRFVKI